MENQEANIPSPVEQVPVVKRKRGRPKKGTTAPVTDFISVKNICWTGEMEGKLLQYRLQKYGKEFDSTKDNIDKGRLWQKIVSDLSLAFTLEGLEKDKVKNKFQALVSEYRTKVPNPTETGNDELEDLTPRARFLQEHFQNYPGLAGVSGGQAEDDSVEPEREIKKNRLKEHDRNLSDMTKQLCDSVLEAAKIVSGSSKDQSFEESTNARLEQLSRKIDETEKDVAELKTDIKQILHLLTPDV